MVLPVDLSISLVVHHLLHCHQMGRVQGSPGAEPRIVRGKEVWKGSGSLPRALVR